jgi:1,4-alpha-glucan branching enzyme
MNDRPAGSLDELIGLYGIQAAYDDAFGRRREAGPEALFALLRALGAEVAGPDDVPAAIAARRRELASRLVEPVAVAWEGRLDLPVRPPAGRRPPAAWECLLSLEEGEERRYRIRPEPGPEPEIEKGAAGGESPHVLRFPESLPLGYHRLTLRAGRGRAAREARVLVIAAPRTTYGGEIHRSRVWGTFLPLYALETEASWGVGDLADLERLVAWTAGLGGAVVGTLPLFAAFLGAGEEPCDPSPYGPASRLFWNELYLDVGRALTGEGTTLPELERSVEARELLGSSAFEEELAKLRKAREVDYREAMRVRRRLLELLARQLFAGGGRRGAAAARRKELEAFREEHPELDRYAAFRALTERLGPWQGWEKAGSGAGAGRLAAGDAAALESAVAAEPGAEDARRYHLYAQWLTHRRLHAVAGRAREEAGTGLYLDLPLGVHPSSYDAWRHPELFVPGVSAGAPPDPFFVQGQDWGFRPAHPERQREEGYGYLRRVLQEVLAVSGMLRIDHVMGLHRLFWVPEGFAATEGAYVRYPAEELYALLCLESHRSRTILVGENLGTVPPTVDQALGRHGVDRMWVAQFGLTGNPERPLEPVPEDVLACLDTHDTPTFPGFLEGRDVDRRLRDGLMEPEEEAGERSARAAAAKALVEHLTAGGRLAKRKKPGLTHVSGAAVSRALLEALAESPARTLLVNLEDLWGETEQQNEPGTGADEIDRRPSWRRKARRSFEAFAGDEAVVESLRRVDAGRRQAARARELVRQESRPAEPPRPAPLPAPVTGEALGDANPLTEEDLYLFNEGRHFRLHDKLGAHPMAVGGEPGVHFAAWAPGASAVSVVGDFNGWRGGAHPLAPSPRGGGHSGVWQGFLPGLGHGDLYKLHVVSAASDHRVDKADPFAFRSEVPPRTGSIVWSFEGEGRHEWGDGEWMAGRGARNGIDAPISIYEVHLGSWRRVPEEDGRSLGYREIAPLLADHAASHGFTHVELLPVMEHPFYGSWGYQTTGYFAPTARYGTPADLMFLIDHLHQGGIGVILDWVPSHFPADQHGLAYFDGTHLFEHADPRQGFHPDWGSLIFNYGRHEVRSFLVSSALYWLDRYHADGLRVDAVASMLYLDYSRKGGEWIPNRYGGRENLEALSFLRELNEAIYGELPDVQVFAEESTAWPMVSRPTYLGGLGFGFKWDMGWMHDTLQYMAREPIHRKYHHGDLTFRMVYAFSESFCLPLSHDEVVHGKGSLLAKMPGDDWQKFANLRLLYAYLTAQPGKKLLFMGGELAPWREWNHDGSLEWHLLEHDSHGGIARVVGDLNRLYRHEPALHELDCDPAGFEWLEANDAEASVLAFLRKGRSREESAAAKPKGEPAADLIACVFNFTPVVHTNYRLGVPRGGRWQELLNTDAPVYWGSGQGNLGGVEAAPVPAHGRSHSLTLTLPPLGAIFLKSKAPKE